MKKFQNLKKTGAGGDQQLSALDEAVIDIIGRESVQLKGLDLPDYSPKIGQKVNVMIPGTSKSVTDGLDLISAKSSTGVQLTAENNCCQTLPGKQKGHFY